MKKFLKSCLRIFGVTLGIIILAWLVFALINWKSWVDKINYYLVFSIILSIVYFLLIYNTFRPQKWYKWILIFRVSLIVLFLWYILFSLIFYYIHNYNAPIDEYHGSITSLISILLSIYWVLLIKEHKIKDKDKKKKIKTALIIFLPFMIVLIRAWFTRAWIISNRFNIQLLFPREIPVWNSHDFPNYWCYDNPNYNPNEPFSYETICLDKPIIYLYPTTETQVNVKLWTPENLSHTYPKYNSEKWRSVIAQPNGELEDMDTWRKLYALYREWKSDNETNFNEWFIVAWEDIIPFLEEKLAILWLNEREAEEFIVYWLPQMEGNEWNLIRFETIEEQNENMSLNITPSPDTVIRVMMDWKAIDEPIDISEQKLITPERNGFTVVEWWWSPRN